MHTAGAACVQDEWPVQWLAEGAIVKEKIPMMGVFLNLPPNLYDRMEAAAKECQASRSGFCRQAVQHYLDYLDSEVSK